MIYNYDDIGNIVGATNVSPSWFGYTSVKQFDVIRKSFVKRSYRWGLHRTRTTMTSYRFEMRDQQLLTPVCHLILTFIQDSYSDRETHIL